MIAFVFGLVIGAVAAGGLMSLACDHEKEG